MIKIIKSLFCIGNDKDKEYEDKLKKIKDTEKKGYSDSIACWNFDRDFYSDWK